MMPFRGPVWKKERTELVGVTFEKKNYKDRTIEVNIGAHTSISRVDKLKDTYSSELNNENGKNIFPAGKDTLHTFSSMKSKQFSHKLLTFARVYTL